MFRGDLGHVGASYKHQHMRVFCYVGMKNIEQRIANTSYFMNDQFFQTRNTQDCAYTQCCTPGCQPYNCRVEQQHDGSSRVIHGDCINRTKGTNWEWKKYLYKEGKHASNYTYVPKGEQGAPDLEHVMSVFGQCLSGSDSVKMWAVQVAATKEGRWPSRINRRKLESQFANTLAAIYMTELENEERCGPRYKE